MTGNDFISQLPESAQVIDSSKMSDWMTCPRMYLFQHLLGWRSDEVNIHFVFGTAAHLGREYLRLHGYDESNMEGAIEAFESHYNTYYDFSDEDTNRPKNKDGFITLMLEHIKKFKSEVDKWDLLYTEVGFAVPINDKGDLYHGRIDAIYWDKELGVFNIDDKFSTWDNDAWREQWWLSFQVRGYQYALLQHGRRKQSVWSEEDVWGTIIDSSITKNPIKFKKDGSPYASYKNLEYDEHGNPYRHKHNRLEIPLTPDQLEIESWLFEVNYELDGLNHNFDLLSQCSDDEPVMNAFPRRPKSCIQYNKPCKFFDLCYGVNNPLRLNPEAPPVSMVQEFWDPRTREQKTNLNKLKG